MFNLLLLGFYTGFTVWMVLNLDNNLQFVIHLSPLNISKE